MACAWEGRVVKAGGAWCLSRMRRIAVVLGVLAVVFASSSAARAHGRFPQTAQIAFHPSDPSVIVVRATFGLLLSDDGGETWRWTCFTAFGGSPNDDPIVVVMDDGAITAASFSGLALGTDGACAWSEPSSELADRIVIDQTADPGNPRGAIVVTSDGGDTLNSVYRTIDAGRTWAPTGPPIDSILFETIRVAPSNPQRIYMTGSFPPAGTEPRRTLVYRSNDGGATWQSFPYALRAGDANIYLYGVDPTAPDRVLMRVKGDAGVDRVVRSDDGGETFVDVMTLPSATGFAWGDDGTVWLSGADGGGLFRSTDRGVSFTQVRDGLSLSCLAARGSELWACGNNFTDGFAIGRSTDGGATFEPMLVLADIAGPVECAAGSPLPACAMEYSDLVRDLALGGGGGDGGVPADGGTGDADGSIDPPGAASDGGCRCSAPGASRSEPLGIAAFLLVSIAALGRLRRRRERSHPPV